jgi:predicted XRE-type DNA-binding protein
VTQEEPPPAWAIGHTGIGMYTVCDMHLTRRRPPPTSQHAEAVRDLLYDVAQQVYDLRTAKGLHQRQLAELAGTTQPRVSTLESVTGAPFTLPLLVRLAAALGTRVVITLEQTETNTP